MIIVFFHVLYFLGKLFYKNYRSTDSSDNEAVENTDEINVSTCGEGTSQLKTSQYDPYSDFYDDNSTKIRFSPPAYIQRYASVTNILTDSKYTENIRKIVDFGCSELGFIRHLKNIKGVEEILCVDIDRNTLEIYKRKVEPLTSDYLVCREAPLTINVYEGSVTQSDECLENCDAVVAIELIEHLFPDTLLDLPHNIFGFIQPQVAVFTTPNADFNVLFKGMSGFRHWDHKFEWTREQFQDWSHNIITRYPNYSVTFAGVCSGPPGSESLGHCSQMAIFHRDSERVTLHGTPGLFKLIASSEYPYRVDTRSDEEKILDDATYYIRSYALNNEDEEMSLELLAKWMNDVSVTALKDVLESEGWTLVNHEEKGISVMCQRYSESSEYDIESVDIADDSYNYADDSYNHAADVEEDWDSEPGPPVYRQEMWPEIHDQDEENLEELIDEEHELPSVSVILASNLSVDSASPELSADTSINRLLIDSSETHAERSGGSFNKTFDGSLLMESGLSEADINQTFDASTLASICSMYLQSSSCENHEKAPENISNPEFQTSEEFDESSSPIEDCRKKLQYSCEKQSVTSTPVDLRLGYYRRTSEDEELNESLSSGTLEKSADRLRGSALMATFDEVEESENSGIFEKLVDKTGEFSIDDDGNEGEEAEVIEKRPLFLESLKEVLRERMAVKEAEEKGAEARESPLNSWSPEVMDSGYPNTSSGHDITPECDLSSIGNDKVSEEEFVGVDEVPRRPLEVEADGRVENGDLANNNRDGEGNNVDPVEENEFDDLQPIIDGLENDLENENDIYDFQNGFPVWLLRILDAEGAGGQPGGFHIGEGVAGADADNIQHDEGIDSSSSDNESENEEADENKNINKDENQQIDTSDEDNNDDIDKHDGELRCAKDA